MKYTGENTVMIRHEQRERATERVVSNTKPIYDLGDEGGDYTSVNAFICLKTNTPLTEYCKQAGGPGCIFGRIGQCQGTKMIRVCEKNNCGKIQGE